MVKASSAGSAKSKLLERITLCFMLTLFLHLMITIRFTEQREIQSFKGKKPAAHHPAAEHTHPASIQRSENGIKYLSKRQATDGNGNNKELILTSEIIHYLMKKYANNEKMQNYLRVLKKKKMENDESENDSEDYAYQGKFRF